MFYNLITLKPGGEVLKLRVEISVGEEEILIRCNKMCIRDSSDRSSKGYDGFGIYCVA